MYSSFFRTVEIKQGNSSLVEPLCKRQPKKERKRKCCPSRFCSNQISHLLECYRCVHCFNLFEGILRSELDQARITIIGSNQLGSVLNSSQILRKQSLRIRLESWSSPTRMIKKMIGKFFSIYLLINIIIDRFNNIYLILFKAEAIFINTYPLPFFLINFGFDFLFRLFDILLSYSDHSCCLCYSAVR